MLAEVSEPFVLQVQRGRAGRNLKLFSFKAGPGDKGRARRAPTVFTMTVTDALRIERAAILNGSAKAASLDRNVSFDVHQRCLLTEIV